MTDAFSLDPSTLRDDGRTPWLLLHGFTGHPGSWQSVVDAVRVPISAVAPPLPGHADGPDLAGSFEDNARALAAAVRAAGIHRAGIAGYSLGARLALGLLSVAPDLVDRLLLIGVNPGLSSDAERVARRSADGELAALLRDKGIGAFVDRWERLPLFASQSVVPRELREIQRTVRLLHDAGGLARSLETMGLAEMPDYRELIARTPVPITLVTGALDGKFTAIAKSLVGPGVGHEIVPEAGHNLLLEAPDAVAAIVDRLSQAGAISK